jgi:hypothetical protein
MEQRRDGQRSQTNVIPHEPLSRRFQSGAIKESIEMKSARTYRMAVIFLATIAVVMELWLVLAS